MCSRTTASSPCHAAFVIPIARGKVESAVGHTQRKLLGLRFEAIEEAQAYLDRFDATWAGTRIHGTTKRQVSAMFAEEKPYLLTLPEEPMRYFQYGRRRVHLDGCVEVDRAYYAPPPGYLGRELSVQWNNVHVRIIDPATGELLREHLKQKPGGRRIREGDEPKRTPLSTLALLDRADRISEQAGRLCRRMHAREGEVAVRRIQGLLALARKHGVRAVDEACGVALDVGVPEYQFVRRYVGRRVEEPLQLTLRHVDPLIRDLNRYRDLIGELTDPNTEGEKT